MSETAEQAQARYLAGLHAMQSGVASKMAIDPSDTTPKHIRVGINSALVSNAAVVRLLISISKGVFTWDEFYIALADAMDEEVRGFEKLLSDYYGTKVTLA